jgi:chromosomal replication initiator protein
LIAAGSQLSVRSLPLTGPWPRGEEPEAGLPRTGTRRNDRAANTPAWHFHPAQTFLYGPENAGVAALLGELSPIAESLGNPIVVAGPPGTGKTHLARGIAAAWIERGAEQGSVLLYTGQEFLAESRVALERNQLVAWQTRVRGARLFILDDLQQLAGQTTGLLELRATIDELLANGAQVLITTRLEPEHLPNLSPAFVARLQSGLSLALQPPGTLVRTELWLRYAAAQQIDLMPAVAESLANGLKLTAGEIWQLADELAVAIDTGRVNGSSETRATRMIRAEQAKLALASQRPGVKPNIRTMTNLAARYFGIKVPELLGPTRRRTVVTARNLVIYMARQLGQISLEQLGKHFGGRDHTTVLHGYRVIEERLQTDPQLRQAHDELRKMIAQGNL